MTRQAARGIPFTSAARVEFAELTADYDPRRVGGAVVAAFGGFVQQGHGLDPWSAVARLIEIYVEAGRPGSFIRSTVAKAAPRTGLDECLVLAEHRAVRISLSHRLA